MAEKIGHRIIEELQLILGKDNVLSAEEELLCYGYDAAPLPEERPAVVVFPTSTAEVSEVLRLAYREELPVVPRGSGTNLSGGTLAPNDAMVLCFTRMNRILAIDEGNLTVTVEPGVITAEVHKAVEAKGLFYPPDPGSMTISTMGGNIMENAGGLRAFKYGITGDYVMALEFVLANGEVLQTGSEAVKDVAGYNISRLLVGSEGTLAVVTRATLRLIPKPPAKTTMVALFPRLEQAALTVSDIVASGLVPTTLEFLDRVTLQAVSEYTGLKFPAEAESMLLIEVDGHPEAIRCETEQVHQVCQQNHAIEIQISELPEEQERLTLARRSALPALARIRPTTVLEDATVPRHRLAEMIEEIRKIASRHNLLIGTFGHAGDGNFHPTILLDKRNAEEMERMEQALDDIFAAAVRLGGTITGEHGIGIAKARFLGKMYSDKELTLMRGIKRAFDPKGILNPNKILRSGSPK